MPTVPVRDVGQMGLVTDLSPQDTPFTAFSDARNVRFAKGKISRYSVFKALDDYTYSKTPVGIIDGSASGAEGSIITIFNDGSMEERLSGLTTDVTPTGSLAVTNAQPSFTALGGLIYVNRPGDVPVKRTSLGGAFEPLTNWDPLDRAKVIRRYKDFLIALDVTKGAITYPAMVKWSTAVQAGTEPVTWDPSDTSELAGETVLNDMQGAIIDGLGLGDAFIVYGEDSVYRMDWIGQPLLFAFTKVFEGSGMIAPNCAVEVNNLHYVFGDTNLYMHDGIQMIPIGTDRVAERVFSELDYSLKSRCFMYHDRANSEVGFAYPSNEGTCPWSLDDTSGCNRAAVFNYQYQTWTLIDLPGVVGWTFNTDSQIVSWEDLDDAWEDAAYTWRSFALGQPRSLIFASTANASLGVTGKPYFLDLMTGGAVLNSVSDEVHWDAWVKSTIKDLDELGIELYGRKLISRIVPQVKSSDPDTAVEVAFGFSTSLNHDMTWLPTKTFNPWSQSKYDTRVNGNYLAFRLNIPAGSDAEMSGYDLEVQQISRR